MSLTGSEEALVRAAKPVLERLRRLEDGAEQPLRKILNVLASHLLEPGFNAVRLFEAAGVPAQGKATDFRRVTGLPPAKFIQNCRMEVAAALLRDTRMPIHRIGELSGFTSAAVFTRAFSRWAGRPPSRYRRDFESKVKMAERKRLLLELEGADLGKTEIELRERLPHLPWAVERGGERMGRKFRFRRTTDMLSFLADALAIAAELDVEPEVRLRGLEMDLSYAAAESELSTAQLRAVLLTEEAYGA